MRIVALTAEGMKAVPKNRRMELITSSPKISHVALKKPEVRPSGPGDLWGLSLSIALVIDVASGREESKRQSASEHR